MKRVMLAIASGLLLSCQGPAAVLAQEATTTAGVGAEASALIQPTRAERALDEAVRLAAG
ncbi:hypothetical protein [Brevundimonas sp.]|uniref:hypothetical protein n=1 Tax=Brevundimonas sp. TaxID=1871086 RepID=UPI00356221F2